MWTHCAYDSDLGNDPIIARFRYLQLARQDEDVLVNSVPSFEQNLICQQSPTFGESG